MSAERSARPERDALSAGGVPRRAPAVRRSPPRAVVARRARATALVVLAAFGAAGVAETAGCARPERSARAPVAPAAYDVTVEVYALPLALAERLEGLADEREPVLTSGLDLDARLARIAAELAHELGVERVVWPVVRAPADVWTRVGSPMDARGPFAGLELAVDPMPRDAEWAPTTLDVSVTWRAPDGTVLARLPSSAHPLPNGSCARVLCLPPRARADELRALAAFVRVVPERRAGP
ncbi:MAG: hypothetical protein IPJ77_08700 [Planctomycetes bacterium]|nr:hypothetical protein [Planctomycetota bacterium]